MNRNNRLLLVVGFLAVTPAFADTLSNDEISNLASQGYKAATRNGEVVYCRQEAVTGSHFKKTSCKTADQIRQIARDSKDLLAEKQLPSGNPSAK